MADRDDVRPLAEVIPLAGRRRRAPPETEAEREARFEQLEREERDVEIAQAETDLERGDPKARLLRFLNKNLRAMDNFERGDRAAAFAEWDELVAEDPREGEILLTRALFHRCADQEEAAIADYDRAAELWPQHPKVYEGRGLCFHGTDYALAAANFRRWVQLCPKSTEAQLWLARALDGLKDHEGAIRACGRALKIDPWCAEAFEVRARIQSWHGSRAEAKSDLDRCLALEPGRADALRMRAGLHEGPDASDRKLADLSRSLELEPDCAETRARRARCHAERGDHQAAIADFTRALEEDRYDVDLLEGRAESATKAGALDQALEDLSLLLEMDRHDGRTSWARAAVHRLRGDLDKAIEDYRHGAYEDPEQVQELEELEAEQAEGGDEAAHLATLATLMLVHPEGHEWPMKRAAIHEKAGRHEEALADLDRAVALNRYWGDSLHERAQVLGNLGRFVEAEADETRAIALQPYECTYHAWRGMYRILESGPSEAAEADLRKALELDLYGEEDILFHWAWYLEESGRFEEEVRVHGERIERDPWLAILYLQRGEARLRAGSDEATLRAALADFDEAERLEYGEPDLAEARAALLARLGE